MQYKGISSELSFKDIDEKGIVTGYLTNNESVDSDGDIFLQSTFTKSINERGPNSGNQIKYLLDHKQDKAVGVFNVLESRAEGIYYEAKAGTHATGKDYIEMCKSGIITQHSVGFKIIQRSKSDNRIISEGKLWEGSGLQCWGANSRTPLISVKGESNEFDPEYFDYLLLNIKRYERAYNAGTFTDETFTGIIIPNLKAFILEASTIITSIETKGAELITPEIINPTREQIINQFLSKIN